MDERLLADFELEMMRLYEEAKRRCGYNATYFLEMVTTTAFDTARQLAGDPRHHEGLTRLWEENALDLSVEALVLRQPWRQLFEQQVLEQAAKKLRALDYWEPGFDVR